MNKQEEITRLEETLDELTASVSKLSGNDLNWLSSERAHSDAVNRVRTLALKAAHKYRERGEPTPKHVESALVFMLGAGDVERTFAQSQARDLLQGRIFVEDESLTVSPIKLIGGGGWNAVNRLIETDIQRSAAGKLFVKHMERLKNSIVAHLQRKNCNQPTVHVNGVLSNTWIRVFGHLDTVQDPEKFRKWLTTSGLNETNRHLRACVGSQLSRVPITEGVLCPHAQISDYYSSKDAAIDADRMLTYASQISEEFGSIMRLYNVEDLTFDEIAHRLDKNKEAIRTQYYRGLRKLRTQFQKDEH